MGKRLPVLVGTFTAKETAKFYKQASRIIHNLNARMRKLGFQGKMDLGAGRAMLLAEVGGPCRYCKQRIKVSTMTLDHPIPLARGGNPWVLEVICDDCNRIKGGVLLPEHFESLTAHLKTYPEYVENYVRGMIKAGNAYHRMLTTMRMMKKGGSQGSGGASPGMVEGSAEI